MLELRVPPAEAGNRLDRFLAGELAHLSRSRVQALIREGHVLVNAKIVKPGEALRPADVISWEEPALVESVLAPEEIALDVLYEDADLLVVNKPPDLVVHPAAGNETGTLVNALLAHCENLSGIGGERRPGIVHRLDKDTSGCLVVAKHDIAHRALSEQFAGRSVRKRYLAIVEGRPKTDSGLIDQPIGRHPVHRKKMAVIPPSRGRLAQTEYTVRAELPGRRTLIECRLLTGRTHQIRVHLKTLGCAIVNDALYGRAGEGRQLLHSWKLGFAHPTTGEALDFCAAVPADFIAAGVLGL